MAVKSASRSQPMSSLLDQDKRLESIYQLLERGEYEHVISNLRKLGETKSHADQPYLESLVKTANQLCLACIHFRKEVDWYENAQSEAESREGELLQQLIIILRLIDGIIDSKSSVGKEQINKSSKGTASIWERIQALLGLESQPESLDEKPHGGLNEFRISKLKKRSLPEVVSSASWDGTSSPLPTPKHESAIRVADPSIISIPGSNEFRKNTNPYSISDGISAMESSISLDHQSLLGSNFMAVYCLGSFWVYLNEQPVLDWPSSKGKSVFQYLVTHRERPVVKEVLMELFWPEAAPEAARNNLNVAIYGLRQALRRVQPSFTHLLFQDDAYLLNPDLQIWVDFEAFTEVLDSARSLEHQGDLDGALRRYCAAEAMYQGEFMAEDRYDEWLVPQRQQLQNEYLSLLDNLIRHYFDCDDYLACSTMCHKILAVDPFREEAHRYLMRSFLRQGHPHLALRQYHVCVKILREELDMSPMPETTELYEQIRTDEPI